MDGNLLPYMLTVMIIAGSLMGAGGLSLSSIASMDEVPAINIRRYINKALMGLVAAVVAMVWLIISFV